jgi:hypothetical protein
MPLIHSASKKAVGENIKIEEAANKPHAQAVAIALDIQRRAEGGTPKPETAKAEGLYSMPAREALEEHLRLLGEIAGKPGMEEEFEDQAEELPEIEEALTKAEPSLAQIAAGNYRKKKVNIHGLPISIENEKGTIRRGMDRNGNPWAIKMPHDYGYIRNHKGIDTTANDGDKLDVCIGPAGEESDEVHIINQLDPQTGEFDEHKIMIGFPSREEAIESYKLSRNDDPDKVMGAVLTIPIEELKRWIKEGDIQNEAVLKANIDTYHRVRNGRLEQVSGYDRNFVHEQIKTALRSIRAHAAQNEERTLYQKSGKRAPIHAHIPGIKDQTKSAIEDLLFRIESEKEASRKRKLYHHAAVERGILIAGPKSMQDYKEFLARTGMPQDKHSLEAFRDESKALGNSVRTQFLTEYLEDPEFAKALDLYHAANIICKSWVEGYQRVVNNIARWVRGHNDKRNKKEEPSSHPKESDNSKAPPEELETSIEDESPISHKTDKQILEEAKALYSIPAMEEEYAKLKGTFGGKKLDVDIARELDPNYMKDPTRVAGIHHPIVSEFVQRMFDKRMELPRMNEDENVLFLAGGGGSGKGTVDDKAHLSEDMQTVLDGTLSDLKKAKRNIDLALKKERGVKIAWVYRPVDLALNGTVERAHSQKLARIVPLDQLAKAHELSPKTIQDLMEHYAGNPMVEFVAFSNAGGLDDVKMIPPDETKAFVESKSLGKNIGKILARAYIDIRENGYVARDGSRHQINRRVQRHLDSSFPRLGPSEYEGKERKNESDDSGLPEAQPPGINKSFGHQRHLNVFRKALAEVSKGWVGGYNRIVNGKVEWVPAHKTKINAAPHEAGPLLGMMEQQEEPAKPEKTPEKQSPGVDSGKPLPHTSERKGETEMETPKSDITKKIKEIGLPTEKTIRRHKAFIDIKRPNGEIEKVDISRFLTAGLLPPIEVERIKKATKNAGRGDVSNPRVEITTEKIPMQRQDYVDLRADLIEKEGKEANIAHSSSIGGDNRTWEKIKVLDAYLKDGQTPPKKTELTWDQMNNL